MMYLIGLTISAYTFCRLLQLPLSVPRGPAYSSDRIVTWVVAMAGAVVVGLLGLAMVASMLSRPVSMPDQFLR